MVTYATFVLLNLGKDEIVRSVLSESPGVASLKLGAGASFITLLSDNSDPPRLHFIANMPPHSGDRPLFNGYLARLFTRATVLTNHVLSREAGDSDYSGLFHTLFNDDDRGRYLVNTPVEVVFTYAEFVREQLVGASHSFQLADAPHGCGDGIPTLIAYMARKGKRPENGKSDSFWSPPDGVNCFYECLYRAFELHGSTLIRPYADRLITPTDRVSEATSIDAYLVKIASTNIAPQIYVLRTLQGPDTAVINGTTYNSSQLLAYFELERSTPPKANGLAYNPRLLSLRRTNSPHHFALCTNLTALSSYLCACCNKWGPLQHIGDCVLCECGTFYRALGGRGSHLSSCRKRKEAEVPKKKSKSSELVKMEDPNPLYYDPNGYEPRTWKVGQYFADFETACLGGEAHVVYCAVLTPFEGKSIVFKGKHALYHFIEHLIKNKVWGHIWFHNGGKFDFHFLLNELLSCNDTLKYFTEKKPELEILSRGTKIISFALKSGVATLHFRDTLSFMQGSLSKLCKDFGVEEHLAKTSFDHEKIKTWDDVTTHINEASKYCVQDTVALRELYKKFQEVLWGIAPIPINISVSLPGHGLSIMTRLIGPELTSRIHVPSRELYLLCRRAYIGGRVMATRGYFKSTGEDDHLMMFDVVSLYPTVMSTKRFPTGVPKILRALNKTGLGKKYLEVLQTPNLDALLTKKAHKCFDERTIWNVDLSCPEDIHLAFIMSRDPTTGKSTQDLLPKKDIWVTGVELLEALKLGYTVTETYNLVVWPQSEIIFTPYIDAMFNLKKAHSANKNSAGYQTGKNGMNAVSGKFGQKVVDQRTYITPLGVSKKKSGEGVRDIELVLSANKDSIVGMKVVESKEGKVTLPTQLSVFILAHARVFMSRFHSKIDGYKTPTNTLLYTDTDSMIVHRRVEPALRAYLGSALGSLDDEFPGRKIVEAVFLAPKTYSLTLEDSAGETFYKVRCKGIPHRGDVFKRDTIDTLTPITPEEKKLKLEGSVKLGVRYYFMTTEANGVKSTRLIPNLDTNVFKSLLLGQCTIEVGFGTLQRDARKDGQVNRYTITPKWMLRGLNITSWWAKEGCPRVMNSHKDPLSRHRDLTLPKGFTGPHVSIHEDALPTVDPTQPTDVGGMELDLPDSPYIDFDFVNTLHAESSAHRGPPADAPTEESFKDFLELLHPQLGAHKQSTPAFEIIDDLEMDVELTARPPRVPFPATQAYSSPTQNADLRELEDVDGFLNLAADDADAHPLFRENRDLRKQLEEYQFPSTPGQDVESIEDSSSD